MSKGSIQQVRNSYRTGSCWTCRREEPLFPSRGSVGLRAEKAGRKHKLLSPAGREDFSHFNIRRQEEWS